MIVLDARARMQAPGVFRDALLAAQDIVSRLAPNDEVAILALEGPPTIVSPFSNDGKDLRRKLASLAPSDAGGDVTETLVLARRLLEANPAKRGSSSSAIAKRLKRQIPSRSPWARRGKTWEFWRLPKSSAD